MIRRTKDPIGDAIVAARTITTRSGRTAVIPAHVDMKMVVGLDAAGRIVVNNVEAFGNAFTAPITKVAGFDCRPFLFGLTLCCNAYDKGVEDGVVCRACYGGDPGNYLFRWEDGFVELDPIVGLNMETGLIEGATP